MLDRTGSLALFAAAIASGCTAVVMLLATFVVWLQSGTWSTPSVLQTGYDLGVLKARWFLAYQWSWPIHDVLDNVPMYLPLLLAAPLLWWLGGKLARR